MTSIEASKVVLMLMAAFPQGERQSDETIRMYEELILDLDFNVAKAAVIRLIQSSKFLPSIAEVRLAARDVTTGLRRTGLEAWGDVTRAIRQVGSYRVPAFADPLVAEAVRSMGWLELCLGDNESALRARFVDAYDAMSRREHSEAAIAEPLRLKAPSAGEGLVAPLGSMLPNLLGGRAP